MLTRSVVINDDIAQGIISVAENGGDGGEEVFGGCEVIAMTTHGYSGRQHWVGSVTEHVPRHFTRVVADCSTRLIFASNKEVETRHSPLLWIMAGSLHFSELYAFTRH